MRQVKRLLMRECDSGKEGGKLVAIQGPRDTGDIVNAMLSVLYHKESSDVITGIGHQKLPKIVILGSENKRLDQIQETIDKQFIKEATDPPFKLLEIQVCKALKQKGQRKYLQQQKSFRAIFDINQVFVLIDKKFLNHLKHRELDISEVDYLIFDEVHNIHAKSTYVNILNKFIFKHKLKLPPQNNPDILEQKKRIPQILAFFSLQSVLRATQNKDQNIINQFQFMESTFNASLQCLQEQDLVNVERDIVREFSYSIVRQIQDVSHLNHQVQYSLEFLQKARKYLSFRRDGKPRFTCFAKVQSLKISFPKIYFLETENAKITFDQAINVMNEFWASQLQYLKHKQIKTKNIQQEPILESAQWIQNNVIYFSSRIQFDHLIVELFGEDNVKELATQVVISSQQDYKNQLYWVYSNQIFLKKDQSESQVALIMCKILSQMGYLDSLLKPSILKLAETINPSECQLCVKNSDEQLSISIINKQQHEKEENMSISIKSLQTKAYSQYNSQNTSASSNDWEINLYVYNSKPYCQSIELSENSFEKDEYMYYTGNIGKVQFLRIKQSKEVQYTNHFFYIMRCYLEDAYKDFEKQFLSKRKEDDSRYPTNNEWLEFNNNYRKSWKIKHDQPDQKPQSAIKVAARKLYQFISRAEKNFSTQENYDIREIREQIINYLTIGLQTIKAQPKEYLLELESERVCSQEIRDLLRKSDIKIIDCLSYGMRHVQDFVEKLNDTQMQIFYINFIEYGKTLSQRVK